MMKIYDCTDSQARCMLAPFDGGISAEEFGAAVKTAAPALADLVSDAAGHEDAVLILNLAADDLKAPVSALLMENCKEKIAAALAAAKEAVKAAEVIIVATAEIDAEGIDAEAKVVKSARSLVLREDSALYDVIKNDEIRSAPLDKEFLSWGLDGRATVVVNAEQLVRIYAAAKPDYVESKIVLVKENGEIAAAEVKTGTSLAGLLAEIGKKAVKNPLIGGLAGYFVSKDALADVKVTTDRSYDLVSLYGDKDCLADVTLRLAEQAKEESCNKCVLCREGTWHILEIVRGMTEGKAKKEDLEMLLDICPLIHVGAFCSFGQNMANVFTTSAELNKSELEAHYLKKKCPAGVCKAFAKVVIDPEKCTGCGDCEDECPEGAIEGKHRFIYMIDQDLCENCGKCAAVCEEGAIVPQDGTIRVPKKLTKVGKFK